ncbi:MAG: aminotransferase class V-fold PLP-dependent enzyme [Variovorax sp.]
MDVTPHFPIYLDYGATTPVDPRVVDAMIPWLREHFGNPASRSHAWGWEAEEAVEKARGEVADLIGADPREIVWTSGATESNNLAIKGAAQFYKGKGKHLITVKTEHKAVLDTMRELERQGFEVTYRDVQEDGLLDGLKDVEQVFINGDLERRVPHNLNISFNYVEGESLIMGIKGLAVSSGSACTSASLEPSYVLRALGRSDELAHSSLRMTIGRFTTEEEIDYAISTIRHNVAKLRELSPLWEMFKDGIDISTIQWSAH